MFSKESMARGSNQLVRCSAPLLFAALLIAAAIVSFGFGKGKPGQPSPPPPPPNPEIVVGVRNLGLTVMNADGSNLNVIFPDTTYQNRYSRFNPDWAPDASRIVFFSDVQGPGLYLIDPDGSNLQKLVSAGEYIAATDETIPTAPAWSPVRLFDESGLGDYWIAYSGPGGGTDGLGHGDVYMVQVNCPYSMGDPRCRVQFYTDVVSEEEFAWSPDGTRLAVTSLIPDPDNFYAKIIQIFQVTEGTSPDDGRPVPDLQHLIDIPVVDGWGPDWSKQTDRWLAYTEADVSLCPDSGGNGCTWGVDLCSVGIASDCPASVPTDPYFPLWTEQCSHSSFSPTGAEMVCQGYQQNHGHNKDNQGLLFLDLDYSAGRPQAFSGTYLRQPSEGTFDHPVWRR